MSDYIVFFAIMALLGIFYVMYYKKYVFAPKMQRLSLANEFRYARNLNAELISLLWLNAPMLENTGLVFNGATFEDTLDALQNLRDNVYTTATFKQIVGKQKTKHHDIEQLQADIAGQIKMQQQVKDGFNKLIARNNRFAA
ncbi:hypothetical protein ACFGVR_10455 [Mucilaginibacter sp. AW1-3]